MNRRSDEISSITQISLAKFVGRLEEKIDSFAASLGLLSTDVTSWIVAGLLNLPSPVWETLGKPDTVRNMRHKTTRKNKRVSSEVEVDLRTPATGPREVAPKKRRGITAWDKKTPRQRTLHINKMNRARLAKKKVA